MAAKFALDPRDISWGTSLYWRDTDPFDLVLVPDADHVERPRGGAGRSRSRKPRSARETRQCITMTHLPTKVAVHGRYAGYYDRKELSVLTRALLTQLFALLEKRVAVHLRAPGR